MFSKTSIKIRNLAQKIKTLPQKTESESNVKDFGDLLLGRGSLGCTFSCGFQPIPPFPPTQSSQGIKDGAVAFGWSVRNVPQELHHAKGKGELLGSRGKTLDISPLGLRGTETLTCSTYLVGLCAVSGAGWLVCFSLDLPLLRLFPGLFVCALLKSWLVTRRRALISDWPCRTRWGRRNAR